MAVSKMLPTFLKRCTPSLAQSLNQTLRCSMTPQVRCLSLQTPQILQLKLSTETCIKVSRSLHTKSVLYQEETAESISESIKTETPTGHSYILHLKSLAWATTLDDVMEFLKDCNIQGGVDGVHMIYKRNGLAAGRCFVEMASEDDLQKALSLESSYIRERNVEVLSVNKDFMNTIIANYGVPQNKKLSEPVLKLKGLPYDCTVQDVQQFLGGYKIAPKGITLTGQRNGNNFLGFVQFETVEEAEKALEERNQQFIGHRFIDLFKSSINEVAVAETAPEEIPQTRQRMNDRQRNDTPRNSTNDYDNYDMPTRRARFSDRSSGGFSSQNRDTREERERGYLTSSTGHSVQLRGLPFSCTEEDISQFFAPLKLVECEVERYRSGRMSGYARVDFSSHEEAVEAMKKDKEHIEKRFIDLFLRSK